LNPQSLATFNPSLVAGRQSAVVGSAVNNTSTGTVSIVSDADGFLCNTTNTSQRNAISANIPYNVTTPPQTITFTVLYPNGTMAPAKTVTIVSGQTQTLTFSKPSGLFGGFGGRTAIGTAVNNAGGDVSAADIQSIAAVGAATNNKATLALTADADGVIAYGGVIAPISPSKPITVSLTPQRLDAAVRFNGGGSAQWSGTLAAGQTTDLRFRKGTFASSVAVRTSPTIPATLSVTSDTDARLNGGVFGADIQANQPYRTTILPQTLTLSLTYKDGTSSAPQTVTLVDGQTTPVVFAKQPLNIRNIGGRIQLY